MIQSVPFFKVRLACNSSLLLLSEVKLTFALVYQYHCDLDSYVILRTRKSHTDLVIPNYQVVDAAKAYPLYHAYIGVISCLQFSCTTQFISQ
jgi:hypothetical protein